MGENLEELLMAIIGELANKGIFYHLPGADGACWAEA